MLACAVPRHGLTGERPIGETMAGVEGRVVGRPNEASWSWNGLNRRIQTPDFLPNLVHVSIVSGLSLGNNKETSAHPLPLAPAGLLLTRALSGHAFLIPLSSPAPSLSRPSSACRSVARAQASGYIAPTVFTPSLGRTCLRPQKQFTRPPPHLPPSTPAPAARNQAAPRWVLPQDSRTPPASPGAPSHAAACECYEVPITSPILNVPVARPRGQVASRFICRKPPSLTLLPIHAPPTPRTRRPWPLPRNRLLLKRSRPRVHPDLLDLSPRGRYHLSLIHLVQGRDDDASFSGTLTPRAPAQHAEAPPFPPPPQRRAVVLSGCSSQPLSAIPSASFAPPATTPSSFRQGLLSCWNIARADPFL